MKEHLKEYFPQRFPQDENRSLYNKAVDLLNTAKLQAATSRCERKVLSVVEESDEIRLIAGAMNKYGCKFDIARHIACEMCGHSCNGGFDPDTHQIVICLNSQLGLNKVHETILHEMIHMFDYCRVKFDFDNLEHVACSEIRAANLTSCSVLDRLSFSSPDSYFKRTHRYCVKGAAFQSVKAYSPETDDQKLWEIIDKVFPGCYSDLEPFGRRPLRGSQNFKHSYRERFHYGYVY